jgi:transcriptional regulator with XRE-family HTH domain
LAEDTLDLVGRLKIAAEKAGGGNELARKTGIPRRTLEDYLKGRSEPKISQLKMIARAASVSVGWLVAAVEDTPPKAAASPIAPAFDGVPLIGLAECGLRGWYQRDSLSVNASRPGDFVDPDGFAVIAIGHSMAPAGIDQGFICYCSPRTAAAKGDAIYVERQDGAATLKIYRGADEQWVRVEGWLDPEDGTQKPFTDQLPLATVKRIAPVIYVKRKL